MLLYFETIHIYSMCMMINEHFLKIISMYNENYVQNRFKIIIIFIVKPIIRLV